MPQRHHASIEQHQTLNDAHITDLPKNESDHPPVALHVTAPTQTLGHSTRQSQLPKPTPTNQQRERSRTQGTSHGTTIVHELLRSVSHKPRGFGGSLSRLTRPHQAQSPQLNAADRFLSIDASILKKESLTDKARHLAGSGLYEHTNTSGTIRRRSMMRTVDKEDYLLARGANPRTGIVTPGLRSASSSIDEGGLFISQHGAPSSKWRQKGDQWISCDFEDPTPSLTPVNEIQPVLPVADDAPSFRVISKSAPPPPAQNNVKNYADNRYYHNPTRSGPSKSSALPGEFPITPNNQPEAQQTPYISHPSPTNEVGVKRKPLNSPGRCLPYSEGRTVSETLGLGTVQPSAQMRSFSGPVTQPKYFSPDDVGKDLRSASSHNHRQMLDSNRVQLTLPKSSFLDRAQGLKASKQNQAPGPVYNSYEQSDKVLPSLPMNNGPYPFPHSKLMTQRGRQHMENHGHTITYQPEMRPDTTGSGNTVYPYVQPLRVPRRHHVPTQNQQTETVRVYPYSYDDRGHRIPTMTSEVMVGTTNHVRNPNYLHAPANANTNVQGSNFTNTVTSTRMYLNTQAHSEVTDKRPSTLMDKYHMPFQPAQEPSTDQAVMSKETHAKEVPSSELFLPWVRPKIAVRPPMSMRGEGMTDIPKLPYSIPRPTAMADHRQSNTTGTEGSPVGDKQIIEEPCTLISRIAAWTQKSSRDLQETQGETSGLTRKCSRCHDGYVEDKEHNIGGQIPLQEGRPDHTDNDSPSKPLPLFSIPVPLRKSEPVKSLTNATAVSLKVSTRSKASVDDRDHSKCCPECCKEQDCHDGCLGHPSPAPSPTRSERLSMDSSGSESRSTAITPPPISDISAFFREGQTRSSKLAMVRAAFAASFKHRKNASKTSLASSNGSALVSPSTFWGGDGPGGNVGATFVAKKAIGANATIDKQKSTESLKSSRKRTKLKKKGASANTKADSFSGATTAGIKANESRRVLSGPKSSSAQSMSDGNDSVKSRSISGECVGLSIPGRGCEGLGEMLFVPVEAVRMWFKTNPQAIDLGWQVVEYGWNGSEVILATGGTLYTMIYVYSKTGKLEVGEGVSVHSFLGNCLKSILYLLIFAGIAVTFGKILKAVFMMMRVVLLIFKTFTWIASKLGLGVMA